MIILFLISLIITIIIHELSHFIAAKLTKCGVDIVSIGFGKPLYRKEIGKTIYQISPILLGGYVKLRDELTMSPDKDAFTNLPYRKKMFITTAGCIANIITGLIALLFGRIFLIWELFYFGFISIALGVTNLIPFPALDGSYIILVWLEKFLGKEKGYKIMAKLCKIGFTVIIVLNILCIPYLIYLYLTGAFQW